MSTVFRAPRLPRTPVRGPGTGAAALAFALVFSLVAADAFLLVQPPSGDLWAARARESAVAHDVGLRYWFSWFGGTVPGHYSILEPYLSQVVGVELIGAVATAAVVPLVYLLVRGSQHPVLAVWLAAVASAVNLWSGRVPFAQGTALALLVLLAVRADRRSVAGVLTIVTALVSPVCAAFLALGLVGVFVHERSRRMVAAVVGGLAALTLGAIGLYFGSPGPEGFTGLQATFAFLAVAALLLARPAREIRTVLLVSLVVCVVVAVVPNGLGGNFERFAWIWLPVAAAATGRARPRLVMLVTALALVPAFVGSAKDLWVAGQPMSSAGYYRGLTAELDRLPMANYRLEVVPDGTHVAAAVLLQHATLARGYETQSDNAQNAVLITGSLDASEYRHWLDHNAVAYVLIDRTTLFANPEDHLVRTAPPDYLRTVWRDAHWTLYAVARPVPIAGSPGRVIDADQSNVVVAVSRAGSVPLRIRWSSLLEVNAPHGRTARLASDGHGYTTLTVDGPGRYTLTG